MIAYNLGAQNRDIDTLSVNLSISLKHKGGKIMMAFQNNERDSVYFRSTYAIDDHTQLNNIEVFYRFNGGEWEDRVWSRNVEGRIIRELTSHPFIVIAPSEELVFPFVPAYNMNYEIYTKIQASVLFRGRSFLYRAQTPVLQIFEVIETSTQERKPCTLVGAEVSVTEKGTLMLEFQNNSSDSLSIMPRFALDTEYGSSYIQIHSNSSLEGDFFDYGYHTSYSEEPFYIRIQEAWISLAPQQRVQFPVLSVGKKRQRIYIQSKLVVRQKGKIFSYITRSPIITISEEQLIKK